MIHEIAESIAEAPVWRTLLLLCPRCRNLWVYRGRGRVAKCGDCQKDLLIARGDGVVPVDLDGEPVPGRARFLVDVWHGTATLVLEVLDDTGHARTLKVRPEWFGLGPLDAGDTPSGRYPLPDGMRMTIERMIT